MTPILPVTCFTLRRLCAFLAVAFVLGFCFGSLAPNGLRVMWAMPVAVPAMAWTVGSDLCKDWSNLLGLVPLGNSRYHFVCKNHAVFMNIPILPRIDEQTKQEGK